MGEAGSPSKVFRSWSRPQIGAPELPDIGMADGAYSASKMANGQVLKTMQMCTCARYRKRIDPGMPGGINVSELVSDVSPHKMTS